MTTFRRLPNRRTVLLRGAAWIGLGAGGFSGARRSAHAEPPPQARAAFGGRTVDEVLQRLHVPPGERGGGDLALEAPDIAENGAVVPVTVSTRWPGARHLAVLVEKNPTVLAAVFELSGAVPPSFQMRLKFAESSPLVAVAWDDEGHAVVARRQVDVISGSCDSTEPAPEPRAAQPTVIRAQAQGGQALVRLLMQHDMESGQRKDAAGRPVPAWYIETVEVQLNDRPVLVTQWGPAVSKDPYLQLTVPNARPGDRLAVSWVDSHGARRRDEALVR